MNDNTMKLWTLNDSINTSHGWSIFSRVLYNKCTEGGYLETTFYMTKLMTPQNNSSSWVLRDCTTIAPTYFRKTNTVLLVHLNHGIWQLQEKCNSGSTQTKIIQNFLVSQNSSFLVSNWFFPYGLHLQTLVKVDKGVFYTYSFSQYVSYNESCVGLMHLQHGHWNPHLPLKLINDTTLSWTTQLLKSTLLSWKWFKTRIWLHAEKIFKIVLHMRNLLSKNESKRVQIQDVNT